MRLVVVDVGERAPRVVVGRDGRHDADVLVADRVLELDHARVEVDAPTLVAALGAIFEVALYYASHIRKLATNLMVTSCKKFDGKQIIPVRLSYKGLTKPCKLRTLPVLAADITLVLLFVTP